MDQEADTNGFDPQSPAPAAGEPSVPKYRLDEIAARLRHAEEALRVKDELINQHLRPAQPQQEQINFEEMGFDERTGKAILRMINQVADQKVQSATTKVNQQLGYLAQNTEEAKFLARFPDKAGYVSRINEHRQRHYQTTGMPLDMETAYKLVAFDEMASKASAPRAQPAQGQAPAPAPAASNVQAPPTYPAVNPQAGVNQGAAAAPQAQSEMSWEDMEKNLNQAMAGTGLTL